MWLKIADLGMRLWALGAKKENGVSYPNYRDGKWYNRLGTRIYFKALNRYTLKTSGKNIKDVITEILNKNDELVNEQGLNIKEIRI